MTAAHARVRRPGAPETGAPAGERGTARISPEQQRYLSRRRIADVVIGTVGLLLAAVPMLVITLGVLVTMGRPILFTQERVTKDERVFRLVKFRSMRLPSQCGTDDDAARLVPFGRLLRETSLDELPSLWNIVRGDVSLVGPRPLPTEYLRRYSGEQRTRHAVPAGLTGLAQVRGRNALGWDSRLAVDLEYVRRLGPVQDLQILVATVVTVLRRHGVTDADGVSMSDFPGPQSTSELELEGPGGDGSWRCEVRGGGTLIHGVARELEPGLFELEILPVSLDSSVRQSQLEDALLLLVSRLRLLHGARWAAVRPTTVTPPLASALDRSGFITLEEMIHAGSARRAGAATDVGGRWLVAFLGFDDEDDAFTGVGRMEKGMGS